MNTVSRHLNGCAEDHVDGNLMRPSPREVGRRNANILQAPPANEDIDLHTGQTVRGKNARLSAFSTSSEHGASPLLLCKVAPWRALKLLVWFEQMVR